MNFIVARNLCTFCLLLCSLSILTKFPICTADSAAEPKPTSGFADMLMNPAAGILKNPMLKNPAGGMTEMLKNPAGGMTDMLKNSAGGLGPAADMFNPAADLFLKPATNMFLSPATDMLSPATDMFLSPATDMLLNPATDMLLNPATDMLLNPATDALTSFSPDTLTSALPLARFGNSPSEFNIFQETATGMRSFLEDLNDVTAVLNKIIEDPSRESEKSSLMGFRDNLDTVYTKTLALYNQFHSTFSDDKSSDLPSREETLKPGNISTARQNIVQVLSQLGDDAVRSVKDSLLPEDVQKSLVFVDEDRDEEEKKDLSDDNASKDSNENALFGTFKEWSDAVKNLRQRPWAAINDYVDVEKKGSSDIAANDKVTIFSNVNEPLANSNLEAQPNVHPGSSSLGGSRVLTEDSNRTLINLFRTRSNSNTSNDSAKDEDAKVDSKVLSNSIISNSLNNSLIGNPLKTVAEQAVNVSRDIVKVSSPTSGSPVNLVENTLDSFSRLRKVFSDVGGGLV